MESVSATFAARMLAADDPLSALFLADDPQAVLRAAAAVATASCGRVRIPEGHNRRTGMPERDGLFCARIFGPVADLRCLCGKLAAAQFAGQTCDRCGVLCGERRLRGERWGHIESSVPLVHPRLAPRIAAALGCTARDLLAVLRHEAHLRADGSVVAGRDDESRAMGPWHVAARLGAQADELLLTRVPVTPPDWRGTRSDPQDAAYMRLVTRCIRVQRLQELHAPAIILDNEAQMAQQAFDRLYEAVRAELRARAPTVVAAATPRSEALLRAIYADPDDDRPRREYADHLRAAGDLRGEFIALQLGGARPRTSSRPADLLRRNFERWLGPLAAAGATEVVFRRGFPAACKVPASTADPRPEDPAWATLEHLDTDLLALITAPTLRGLRSLALADRTWLGLCAGASELPRITALTVRLARCPPSQPAALTLGAALPDLRALTLVHRPARGEQDWRWLADTPLAHQLERLTVVLALERVEALALPWWIEFMQRHPRLERVDLDLGARKLALALRRDGEWLALRVKLSRGLLERLMLGAPELAAALARGLTEPEPYGLTSVRIEAPGGAWFGDDLAALARAVRDRYGAAATLPARA